MCEAGLTMNALEDIAATREAVAWYAVQTRSRHEKKVAVELMRRGIPHFLPLVKELHNWSDRRKLVEVPLFPGYAFVQIVGMPEQRIEVLRVHGILNFVGAHNIGAPIPDNQIESIRALLTSEVPIKPHQFLSVGQRVRIKGGVLDSMEGILTANNGNRRLVISIETIQRSISIGVEGYEIEAVPASE